MELGDRSYKWIDKTGKLTDRFMKALLEHGKMESRLNHRWVELTFTHPLLDEPVAFKLTLAHKPDGVWRIWWHRDTLKTDAPCEADLVNMGVTRWKCYVEDNAWNMVDVDAARQEADMAKTLNDLQTLEVGVVINCPTSGMCPCGRHHPTIVSFVHLQKMLIELGYELLPAEPNVCFALDAPHGTFKMISFRKGRKFAAIVDADTYQDEHMGMPYMMLHDGQLAVYHP